MNQMLVNRIPSHGRRKSPYIEVTRGYLANMVLFKVYTAESISYKGDWEVEVPELYTTIFVIPANFCGRETSKGVKNGTKEKWAK
jgi:hypothetical protein